MREDVTTLVEVDLHLTPVVEDVDQRVMQREQHAMIETIANKAQDFLQRDEVEDVVVVIQPALKRRGRAVVVAVQGLALIAFIRNEVTGAEDGVILCDSNAKIGHVRVRESAQRQTNRVWRRPSRRASS